jgi:hypothetical protein
MNDPTPTQPAGQPTEARVAAKALYDQEFLESDIMQDDTGVIAIVERAVAEATKELRVENAKLSIMVSDRNHRNDDLRAQLAQAEAALSQVRLATSFARGVLSIVEKTREFRVDGVIEALKRIDASM